MNTPKFKNADHPTAAPLDQATTSTTIMIPEVDINDTILTTPSATDDSIITKEEELEEEEEDEEIMGMQEEEEEEKHTNNHEEVEFASLDSNDIITGNDGCYIMSSTIQVGSLFALVGSCPNPMDMIPRSPTYHHQRPPPVVAAPPMPLNANDLQNILQDALAIANEFDDMIFDD